MLGRATDTCARQLPEFIRIIMGVSSDKGEKMKQAFRITLGVFLLLWAVVSQAEVRIEITQG